MLRGIDDFEALLVEVWVDLAAFDQSDIVIIDLLVEDHGFFLLGGFRNLEGEFVRKAREDIEHRLDDVGDELAAGFVVKLIAVIFLRVVGSGDHDAADAIGITDRIREFWGRAKGVEEVALDAHLIEDLRGKLREFAGHVAVVVRNGDATAQFAREFLLEEEAEGNRDATNGMDVHAVGAGTQDPAHAAGAEFDVFEEGICLFFLAHLAKDGLGFFVHARRRKPTFVTGFNAHSKNSLSLFFDYINNPLHLSRDFTMKVPLA